jgi:hypothetical protein
MDNILEKPLNITDPVGPLHRLKGETTVRLSLRTAMEMIDEKDEA